jgi:hypothetical protein
MTLPSLVPQHIQDGNIEIYVKILKNASMPDKMIERIRSFSRSEMKRDDSQHHVNFSTRLALDIQSKRKFDSYGNPIKSTESNISRNLLVTRKSIIENLNTEENFKK